MNLTIEERRAALDAAAKEMQLSENLRKKIENEIKILENQNLN
jgi:hypothetical protein